MTLTKRIIACLDVNAGRVVKGVQFVDIVDAGDPAVGLGAKPECPPRNNPLGKECTLLTQGHTGYREMPPPDATARRKPENPTWTSSNPPSAVIASQSFRGSSVSVMAGAPQTSARSYRRRVGLACQIPVGNSP